MINDGTYLAKLISYGIQEGKDGKAPLVVLRFKLNDSGSELTSWLSLSGGAAEITLKTLNEALGFMCDPSEIETYLSRIAVEGIDSGLLDTDRDVSLVLENQEYNGKTNTKIKYINDPKRASRGFEKLAKDKAMSMFSGLNLSATMAKVAPPRPKDNFPL